MISALNFVTRFTTSLAHSSDHTAEQLTVRPQLNMSELQPSTSDSSTTDPITASESSTPLPSYRHSSYSSPLNPQRAARASMPALSTFLGPPNPSPALRRSSTGFMTTTSDGSSGLDSITLGEWYLSAERGSRADTPPLAQPFAKALWEARSALTLARLAIIVMDERPSFTATLVLPPPRSSPSKRLRHSSTLPTVFSQLLRLVANRYMSLVLP